MYQRGAVYDLTYRLPDTSLVTIQFREGAAAFFRYILARPTPNPAHLLRALGLEPTELIGETVSEVQHIWHGQARDVELERVVVTAGPDGWHMAEVWIGQVER